MEEQFMKNDLKVIFSSTVIYIGLLIGAALILLIFLFFDEKIPGFSNAVKIFGIVYYFVLFGYIFIRRLIKKNQSPE